MLVVPISRATSGDTDDQHNRTVSWVTRCIAHKPKLFDLVTQAGHKLRLTRRLQYAGLNKGNEGEQTVPENIQIDQSMLMSMISVKGNYLKPSLMYRLFNKIKARKSNHFSLINVLLC